MGRYRLKCLECGGYADEMTYALRCDGHAGLLRAEYEKKQLTVGDMESVFKFSDWLPVSSEIPSRSCPIAFKNDALAKEIGVKDLWIGFTGYYPERNAFVTSCSFKEMEALPTMARIRELNAGTVVVASAGNTGRAFAQISNETGMRSVIIVPRGAENRITVSEDNGMSKLITVEGDYADAIALSERISSIPGHVPEGGARNVARRDGMGTVMLQAAVTMGKIPDQYFQAIGSGTGGISAWEASMRLIGDGRFGEKLPELHLSQNSPFTPMKNAWDAGRRNIVKDDANPDDIPMVYADVLTNRSPPFGMAGGVYDAMTACGGSMMSVTNEEAKDAERIWGQHENASLDPAAAVALASLIKSSKKNFGTVLLNITGGGYDRVREDMEMITIRPFANVGTNITDKELRRLVDE